MRPSTPTDSLIRQALDRIAGPLPRLGATALTAAALTLTASASAAWASHSPSLPGGKAAERRLQRLERIMLGPEHAAEHALERRELRAALRRWKGLTPTQRRAALRREREISAALAADAGPPSVAGAWTTAPFSIPNYAVHAAVLPTGKVLLFGYPIRGPTNNDNNGLAALWDPSKGTGPGSMREVPPPLIDADGDGDLEKAPIFYGGQTMLPSGALLVAGGNLVWPLAAEDAYTEYAGIDRVFSFDPWQETWTEQPRMSHGRWYPSLVELADGRIAILSGYTADPPGEVLNPELELFTASRSPSGTGTIERRPSGDRDISIYPHLFTLPGGEVLLGGPAPEDSALLDTGDFAWEDLSPGSRYRYGSSAVLMPGGPVGSSTVMQIGGYPSTPGPDGVKDATTSSDWIDGSDPADGWRAGPDLNLPRDYQNTVQLPDGSMVTVGGARGRGPPNGLYLVFNDGGLRQVELYDPVTGSWRLGAAQQEDRTYHSVAVLLPDGRVMSAGDDLYPLENGGKSTRDTAEIYSPPYLFRGPRPRIGWAPPELRWADSFGVATEDDVSRAVLMAPSATTHAVDMTQRHVELAVSRQVPGRGVELAAPPTPAIAPPGYYMLFLLNDAGVPSVASWVRLDGEAPDQPLVGERPSVRLRVGSARAALRHGGRLAVRISVRRPLPLELALSARSRGLGRGAAVARRLRAQRTGDLVVTLKLARRLRRRLRHGRAIRIELVATDELGNSRRLARSLSLG